MDTVLHVLTVIALAILCAAIVGVFVGAALFVAINSHPAAGEELRAANRQRAEDRAAVTAARRAAAYRDRAEDQRQARRDAARQSAADRRRPADNGWADGTGWAWWDGGWN